MSLASRAQAHKLWAYSILTRTKEASGAQIDKLDKDLPSDFFRENQLPPEKKISGPKLIFVFLPSCFHLPEIESYFGFRRMKQTRHIKKGDGMAQR